MYRYGWSFIEIPEPLLCNIKEFYGSVSADWKTDNKGNKNKNNTAALNFHSTFVSRLDPKHQMEIVQKFQSILGTMKPVSVSLDPSGLFISPVKRITSANIWCAGLSLVSPELKKLREHIASSIGDQATVYYDADGHISVVYVEQKHKEQLEQHVEMHGQIFKKENTFTIDHIMLSFPDNTYRVDFQKQ